MGIEYNQKVSNSVHTTALSGQKSTCTPVLSNRTGMSGQRNPGHATQRSSGRNPQSPGKGRFLFQHVPGPQKKKWPAETGIQTKKAKYFCTHPTLQNGGGAYVERHSQARGLVSKNRSERCVFHDPSSSSGQDVPEISKSRENISIQVPTIWPIQCTLALYQDPRPVVTLLEELGLRMVVYIDDIVVMAESEAQLKDHVQCLVYLLENLGYIINYKKISVDTNKTVGVSRVHSGLRLSRAETSNRQGQDDQAGCPEITKAFTHNSTGTISIHREVECGHKSHSSSALVLQRVAEGPQQSPRSGKSGLRGPVSTVTAGTNRTRVVDHTSFPVEWDKTQTHNVRGDRCREWGGNLQRCSDQRSLVHKGTILAHKLPRIVGSNASNSVLCQRQKEYNHSTVDEQHHSSIM